MSRRMGKTMDTYCIDCDEGIKAIVEDRPDELTVRGEAVPYMATVAVCPHCGRVIADSRLESLNLERAYTVYRQSHSIMSPEEIRTLRGAYGLSLRAFSSFLGFGEQTVARYESGSMPDESHNAVLLMASTEDGARSLLAARRSHLPEKTIDAVERFISSDRGNEDIDTILAYAHLPRLSTVGPSSMNGFRPLDMGRVASVVRKLSSLCPDLFWTKLQKALYFTDALAFEFNSRSMTGLQYAHADHGPVVEGRDAIRVALTGRDVVRIDEASSGWGEIVTPGTSEVASLGADDAEIVERVAGFVNTFPTAGALSDYSHTLHSWMDTRNGESIEYTTNVGEVSAAIERRLAKS